MHRIELLMRHSPYETRRHPRLRYYIFKTT